MREWLWNYGPIVLVVGGGVGSLFVGYRGIAKEERRKCLPMLIGSLFVTVVGGVLQPIANQRTKDGDAEVARQDRETAASQAKSLADQLTASSAELKNMKEMLTPFVKLAKARRPRATESDALANLRRDFDTLSGARREIDALTGMRRALDNRLTLLEGTRPNLAWSLRGNHRLHAHRPRSGGVRVGSQQGVLAERMVSEVHRG